ncbi:hypothetical protein [Bacillus sp. WP8]|nr:hypothetical protein [Bacillus sp. WP8]
MKTNKTVICVITKKDLYASFFCGLFMTALTYYVFIIHLISLYI